ncbi:MAG TPA: SAM-dependent methyltransferase [Chitinophagaceae bacterium]|nr:SAM-dependent methyltransferase [Chitinophagaceae bacterium]HNF72879.1 SAM-dependent methyltransferase [Chitinophagaceae bacterium]
MPGGNLHLIPNLLAEEGMHGIPLSVREIIPQIRVWYVEELRSARRFLKKVHPALDINVLRFHLVNEHRQEGLTELEGYFEQGWQVGVMSESGCPAIADPGSLLVQMAHQLKVRVIPYVGPNSILLALMGSGFNGQHFQFWGYLPYKQPELKNKILEIERDSRNRNCSQFFIEAPYRNDQLLSALLETCHPETRLSVACNLTGETEEIVSMPCRDWRKQSKTFHKRPAIFGLYAGI